MLGAKQGPSASNLTLLDFDYFSCAFFCPIHTPMNYPSIFIQRICVVCVQVNDALYIQTPSLYLLTSIPDS